MADETLYSDPNGGTAPGMSDILSGGSPVPNAGPVVGMANSPTFVAAGNPPGSPAVGAPHQSPWAAILTGALAGLANSGKAKTFTGGLAAGAEGAMENARRTEQVNMQKTELASRIKFQDAQSANLAAEAAIHDKQLHNMDQEAQDAHNAASLSQLKELQALGLTPTLVVDNNHGGKEVTAGLSQLTDSHGAVPPMFTLNIGNKIVGFDLNQLTQAPQGLDAVNKMRQITNPGAPAIDQKTWAQMPQQMRVEQLNSALGFDNPTPSEQNLATYKNYLTTLQAAPDSPDKAANVAKFQGIVSRMQAGLDSMNKRANAQNAAKEGAVEQAKVAADNSPTAIAGARAKAQAEAEGKNAADQKAFGNITDPFGNKIGVDGNGRPLDRKELDAKQKTFDKEFVQPITKLQKTVNQFDAINNDPNQTGAQKVTALLAAVGISGDALKGQGFRISKDVIDEHAQARNIWDTAVQRLNKVGGSGGPITSKQIADYTKIAQDVVHEAYVSAAQEAKRQGLPVDFLPKPTGQNQKASDLVLSIYADSAGGNLDAAHKALTAAGWK